MDQECADRARDEDFEHEEEREREIDPAHAEPGAPVLHQADGQPMLQDEHVGRSGPEHDPRVAIEPVGQPPERAERQVLLHGEGLHGAQPATIQIAGGGMVDRMGASPIVVWGHGEHPGDPADPGIGRLCTEE